MVSTNKSISKKLSILERSVKANDKRLKKIDKRLKNVENFLNKEMAEIHAQVLDAVFEAFGFVPPSMIGSEAIKLLKKKYGEEYERAET